MKKKISISSEDSKVSSPEQKRQQSQREKIRLARKQQAREAE
jgi:hypothetical protein